MAQLRERPPVKAYEEWAEKNLPVEDFPIIPQDQQWRAFEYLPPIELVFEDHVRDLLVELGDLLVSKQKDYGPHAVNLSPYGPLKGLNVRLHDKLQRAVHLEQAGSLPNYESLRDTYRDLANYAVIAHLVLDGTWPSE